MESFTFHPATEDAASPSEGVYYVAPLRRGWQVLACRYSDINHELDHTQFWVEHVCRRLAGEWAVKKAKSFNWLREWLKEHAYGFPRGRVVFLEGKYHVYHGSDIPNASRINRGQIEAIFGISGNCKWVKDDHEHCLEADKLAVRDALALEDDWFAV